MLLDFLDDFLKNLVKHFAFVRVVNGVTVRVADLDLVDHVVGDHEQDQRVVTIQNCTRLRLLHQLPHRLLVDCEQVVVFLAELHHSARLEDVAAD